MFIRFHRDADGRPHVWSHSVSEQETAEAFARRTEDRGGREDSRVAIGHTSVGRILKLIYVPDPGGDSVFLITAYDLRGKALSAYRRRRRKKGQ